MLADNDNLYWDPEQTLGQEDDEDPAADEADDKTAGDVSVSNDDDIDDAGKDEDDQDEDDRDQNDDPEIRYKVKRPLPARHPCRSKLREWIFSQGRATNGMMLEFRNAFRKFSELPINEAKTGEGSIETFLWLQQRNQTPTMAFEKTPSNR